MILVSVIEAVDDYLKITGERLGEFLFTGHCGPDPSMTTRQMRASPPSGSALYPRLFVDKTECKVFTI